MMTIREDDVDLNTLRERVRGQDGEEACRKVTEAMELLKGLRTRREAEEGTHEVMRALLVAHAALMDAFIL